MRYVVRYKYIFTIDGIIQSLWKTGFTKLYLTADRILEWFHLNISRWTLFNWQNLFIWGVMIGLSHSWVRCASLKPCYKDNTLVVWREEGKNQNLLVSSSAPLQRFFNKLLNINYLKYCPNTVLNHCHLTAFTLQLDITNMY